MNAGDWQHRRPIWLLLTLNSLTSQSNDRQQPVLDQYMAAQAHYNHKRVHAVETVAEQCRPLNQLDDHQVQLHSPIGIDHTLMCAGELCTRQTIEQTRIND